MGLAGSLHKTFLNFNRVARLNTRLLNGLSWFEPGGGGEGTPYDGQYGAASPERGIFFRLQVYERVGISLVAVYKKVEKSVIWVCERSKKANR